MLERSLFYDLVSFLENNDEDNSIFILLQFIKCFHILSPLTLMTVLGESCYSPYFTKVKKLTQGHTGNLCLRLDDYFVGS